MDLKKVFETCIMNKKNSYQEKLQTTNWGDMQITQVVDIYRGWNCHKRMLSFISNQKMKFPGQEITIFNPSTGKKII